MNKSLILASLLALGTASNTYAASTTYGGVTFPDGDISFADKVISYTPGPDASTGWNDPTKALGTPDYSGGPNRATSLGDGGELIVQFTDNSLTTSGDDKADLWIFEIGAAVEFFTVYISTNLTDWINLGAIKGQPTGIDIDSKTGVVEGTKYSYVKLLDDKSFNQTGSPYGEADIDAIGAISSAPPVSAVPVPAASLLFAPVLAGFMAMRRKLKQA